MKSRIGKYENFSGPIADSAVSKKNSDARERTLRIMKRWMLFLVVANLFTFSSAALDQYVAPPLITQAIAFAILPDNTRSLQLPINTAIEIDWRTFGGGCIYVGSQDAGSICPGLRGSTAATSTAGLVFSYHIDAPGAASAMSNNLDTCLFGAQTGYAFMNFDLITSPYIHLWYSSPGVKSVTISLYMCGKSEIILGSKFTYSFYVGGVGLADAPITSRKNGAIVGDPTQLASTSRLIQGIAADGVTQALVVIPSANPGQSFTLSLTNDQGGPGSLALDGALGPLGQTSSQINQNSITVTADNNPSGAHYAVAAYLAPIDFVRGTPRSYRGTCALQTDYDENLPCRTVNLSVVPVGSGNQQAITLPVLIVRTPVMLLHGLWDSPQSAWGAFSPLYSSSSSDSRFSVSLLHYNDEISIIKGSAHPSIGQQQLATRVSRNSLGFAFNAPFVASQIRENLKTFRNGGNPILAPVAATQADIVAHSLGGNVARFLTLDSSYFDDVSMKHGMIHKLLTIDTPHLGSPLATGLITGNNSCIASWLYMGGKPVLDRVTLPSGQVISGAVGDLQDIKDQNGSFVSLAMQQLKTAIGRPLPTGLLAGYGSTGNFIGLDHTTLKSATSQAVFGTFCSSEPFYQAMTSTAWTPTVFLGSPNDGIVAVSSQLNLPSWSIGQVVPGSTMFEGLIHSPGTESIGFYGPTVLDTTQVANQAILLLNTPIFNSGSFVSLNP